MPNVSWMVDELGGAAGAVLLLGTASVAAVRARAHLVPGWRGAPARLAEAVLVLALVHIGGFIAGASGAFAPAPLAATVALLAAIVLLACRFSTRPDGPDAAPVAPLAEYPWWLAAGAGLVVSTAVARWLSITDLALRKGMYAFDTLFYHGPLAARFVQTRSIGGIHHIVPGEAVSYHPANAELVHGMGIAFFGSDVVSPLVNLGWLAVALLSAWCIGGRWHAAPATVAATAALLSIPVVAESQAGSGSNDIVGIACLLAAVALLVAADRHPGARLIAALAAGLAVGTKLSLAVPIAAVTVAAVALAPRRYRLAAAGGWLATMFLTGGFWYGRNLLAVGHPVPALDPVLGPFGLGGPEFAVAQRFDTSLLGGLDPHQWDSLYRPSLEYFLGPAWPVVLAAGLLGLAVSGLRRDVWRRALATVAAISFLGYALTPSTGEPIVFWVNMRYGLPALTLALVLVASDRFARRPRGAAAAVAAAAVVAIIPTPLWQATGWWTATVTTAAVVTLAVAIRRLAVVAPGPARRTLAGLAALAVIGLPMSVATVQDRYLEARYRRGEGGLGRAYDWAQQIRGGRIGFNGTYQSYALYGPDLSNDVQFIGEVAADGTFLGVTDCAAWRQAVNEGGYTHIVVADEPIDELQPAPSPQPWMEGTGSRPVVAADGTTVYEVDGPLDPDTCPGPGDDPAPVAGAPSGEPTEEPVVTAPESPPESTPPASTPPDPAPPEPTAPEPTAPDLPAR